MKTKLLLIIVFNSIFSYSQYNKHVLYGERELDSTNFSIYYDKEGLLYPDVKIFNNKLDESDNSLKKYYANNSEDFKKIAEFYNCKFIYFNENNLAILNDSILQKNLKKIISKANNPSVTFLIHGYRKPLLSINNDSSSFDDFQVMKSAISSNINTFYISVYWDGLYGPKASMKFWKNKAVFKLFEEAQQNAINAGNSFKKLISLVNEFQYVNIVSHSLGAQVALYGLLNFDDENKPVTSSENINILLVAPAISSSLIVDNYYNRNSSINFQIKDNYNLSIVYNELDFVLKKRLSIFGPGPLKYGDTSLGCNYNKSAILLKQDFNIKYPNSALNLVDFTNAAGKSHLVTSYFKESLFKSYIKNLIK
jgi:hypothetical protein